MSEETSTPRNVDAGAAEMALAITDAVVHFEKRSFPTFDAFADFLLDLLRQELDHVDAVRLYQLAKMQGVFNQYYDTPLLRNDIQAHALCYMICREYWGALSRAAMFDVFGL
jgi:hypothetical protein